MNEGKKIEIAGDVIRELPPVAHTDFETISVTVHKNYARKLGKSISKNKCETLADAVKAKESLAFLKSLNDAGLTWEELEVPAEIHNFIQAYL